MRGTAFQACTDVAAAAAPPGHGHYRAGWLSWSQRLSDSRSFWVSGLHVCVWELFLAWEWLHERQDRRRPFSRPPSSFSRSVLAKGVRFLQAIDGLPGFSACLIIEGGILQLSVHTPVAFIACRGHGLFLSPCTRLPLPLLLSPCPVSGELLARRRTGGTDLRGAGSARCEQSCAMIRASPGLEEKVRSMCDRSSLMRSFDEWAKAESLTR